MSVARFIADQRTMHRVPHAVTCAILGVSVSWFYKWVHRKPTPTEVRRSERDAAVTAHSRRRSAPAGHRASMPISPRPAGR